MGIVIKLHLFMDIQKPSPAGHWPIYPSRVRFLSSSICVTRETEQPARCMWSRIPKEGTQKAGRIGSLLEGLGYSGKTFWKERLNVQNRLAPWQIGNGFEDLCGQKTMRIILFLLFSVKPEPRCAELQGWASQAHGPISALFLLHRRVKVCSLHSLNTEELAWCLVHCMLSPLRWFHIHLHS